MINRPWSSLKLSVWGRCKLGGIKRVPIVSWVPLKLSSLLDVQVLWGRLSTLLFQCWRELAGVGLGGLWGCATSSTRNFHRCSFLIDLNWLLTYLSGECWQALSYYSLLTEFLFLWGLLNNYLLAVPLRPSPVGDELLGVLGAARKVDGAGRWAFQEAGQLGLVGVWVLVRWELWEELAIGVHFTHVVVVLAPTEHVFILVLKDRNLVIVRSLRKCFQFWVCWIVVLSRFNLLVKSNHRGPKYTIIEHFLSIILLTNGPHPYWAIRLLWPIKANNAIIFVRPPSLLPCQRTISDRPIQLGVISNVGQLVQGVVSGERHLLLFF